MDRLLPSGESPKANMLGSKNKFTPQEDERLRYFVEKAVPKLTWKEISILMRTRSPRQCRERYQNYLSSKVSHNDFSNDEDQQILRLFNEHGKKWNIIAQYLPGRTGNAVRNRWQWLVKKQKINVSDASSPIMRAIDIRSAPSNSTIPATSQPQNSNFKTYEEFFYNFGLFNQGKNSAIFENDEDQGIFVS